MKQTGLDSKVCGPLAGLSGAKRLIWPPEGFSFRGHRVQVPLRQGKGAWPSTCHPGRAHGWAPRTGIQQAGAILTHPSLGRSLSSGYGNSFILPGTVSYSLTLSSACIKQQQQTRGFVCVLQDGQNNLLPLEPMGLSLLRIMPLVSVLQQKGLEFSKETLSGIYSIDDCNQAWQPLDLTALSGPNQRPLT